MPITYTAIVDSDHARLLRIDSQNLQEFVSIEYKMHLKDKMWQKLKFMMDRVKQLDE